MQVETVVPTDLSEYDSVDASSGWKRHRKILAWLYHTASLVYYNTETLEYYRLENGVAVLVKQETNGEKEQVRDQLRPTSSLSTILLLIHSLSPVLVLVIVMGSMELKIARLFSCSFSFSAHTHSHTSHQHPASCLWS